MKKVLENYEQEFLLSNNSDRAVIVENKDDKKGVDNKDRIKVDEDGGKEIEERRNIVKSKSLPSLNILFIMADDLGNMIDRSTICSMM